MSGNGFLGVRRENIPEQKIIIPSWFQPSGTRWLKINSVSSFTRPQIKQSYWDERLIICPWRCRRPVNLSIRHSFDFWKKASSITQPTGDLIIEEYWPYIALKKWKEKWIISVAETPGSGIELDLFERMSSTLTTGPPVPSFLRLYWGLRGLWLRSMRRLV